MTDVPGETNVSNDTAMTVLNKISLLETVCEMQGDMGVVSGTPVLVRTSIASPKTNGQWIEKWVIQRQQYQVEYTIPFQETPGGMPKCHVEPKPRKL